MNDVHNPPFLPEHQQYEAGNKGHQQTGKEVDGTNLHGCVSMCRSVRFFDIEVRMGYIFPVNNVRMYKKTNVYRVNSQKRKHNYRNCALS
jgi:hypothetical protein